MISLSLPINSKSWLGTLGRWAAELRKKSFLSSDDFTLIPFNPTPIGDGSMTLTGVEVSFAYYCRIGKLVFCTTSFFGTTGGTAARNILIRPPFNCPVSDVYFTGGGHVKEGVNEYGLTCYTATTQGGYIVAMKVDNTNFALTVPIVSAHIIYQTI